MYRGSSATFNNTEIYLWALAFYIIYIFLKPCFFGKKFGHETSQHEIYHQIPEEFSLVI